MHICSMQNLSFEGRTKFLSCDSEGKYKKISEYLYGSSSFGDTRGLQDFILKHSQPYAGIEETIGKFHDDSTFKIYFADPGEVVDDNIKRSHDYIVLDNEPKFPDIKKRFFTSEHDCLDKEFKNVCDYFERAVNTATRKKDRDIAILKHKLADDCRKIFDESFELRKEQQNLLSRIQISKEKIEIIKTNAQQFEKELNVKKATLPAHKHTLEVKERKVDLWADKIICLKSKPNIKDDDLEFAQEKLQKYTREKEALSIKVNHYEAKVLYWENYIRTAPKRIINLSEDIAKMNNRLKEIKSEIKPYYEKLCKFYTTNGIKIIKRI